MKESLDQVVNDSYIRFSPAAVGVRAMSCLDIRNMPLFQCLRLKRDSFFRVDKSLIVKIFKGSKVDASKTIKLVGLNPLV
jgi:hypothetical protein